MKTDILKIDVAQAPECEAILRSLPDWFGIKAAIVEYREQIEKLPTYGAYDGNRLIGFLTVKRHNQYSAEIYVMGVREEYHRKGVGRQLVEHTERFLRDHKYEYYQVKTLAPARESKEYERTRKFYESLGFRPLEENELWGKANPCLIMVKRL